MATTEPPSFTERRLNLQLLTPGLTPDTPDGSRVRVLFGPESGRTGTVVRYGPTLDLCWVLLDPLPPALAVRFRRGITTAEELASRTWGIVDVATGGFLERQGYDFTIESRDPTEVLVEALRKLGYELGEAHGRVYAFRCRRGWVPGPGFAEIPLSRTDYGEAAEEALASLGMAVAAVP